MSNLPVVGYSNRFGDVSNRPQDNCAEIRWFDTTSAAEGEDFNNVMSQFASIIESSGQINALVDAVQFKMDFSKMIPGWREEHIVPRYNAAGLKKFAFVMPVGMPAIGKPPVKDGTANYWTAYFETRQDALIWLNLKE